MNVFLTGATGYVGSRVAQQLVAAGHAVTGLVRDAARGDALFRGVQPLVGTLERFATVRQAVLAADAIIHTAFPQHGEGWAAAVQLEAEFLRELVAALAGSGKRVVVSNGTLFLGDSGSARLAESAPVVSGPAATRAAATRVVTEAPGIHGIELRLASFVYGDAGSVFLPVLLRHARRTGQSISVGDGQVRTSAVHVDAAARAYVLALGASVPAGVFHIASDEEPTLDAIAAAVAIAAGPACQRVRLSQSEAAEALDPFTALFLAANNRLDASRARRELGWGHAGHVPLLWDLAHGSYAQGAR
jgi:nucleoside-diphosphate-sugar epimerase